MSENLRNIKLKLKKEGVKPMNMFNYQSSNGAVTAPVFEGYGAEVGGDVVALMEAHEDYEAIIEAMHGFAMTDIQPEAVLEQHGASDIEVVKEAMVKNALEKVKAFFSKLWGKLKAFFASALRLLDGIFKDGKAFAEKHQTEIRALKVNDMKVKMYEYTHLNDAKLAVDAPQSVADLFAGINTFAGKSVEDAEAALTDLRDSREDSIEGFRGAIVGKGALTQDEYRSELFAHFRDGAEGKQDMPEVGVEPARLLEALKDSAPLKKAQEVEKAMNKEFSTILTELKKIESKLGSAKSKDGQTAASKTAKGNGVGEHSDKMTSVVITYVQLLASLTSAQQKIRSEAFTAWRGAIQERSATYKAVVLKAFRHKEKKN